jgi:hypothetical protein
MCGLSMCTIFHRQRSCGSNSQTDPPPVSCCNDKSDFLTSMRYFVYIFFLTRTFLACKTAFAQTNDLSVYASHFDNELKAWTKTINDFRLSSFRSNDTIFFSNSEYGDIKDLKNFYSIYRPALTFSKDSNKFIDIYSYELNLEKKGNKIVYSGSEVDQAVSLCNIKTRKWKQILFCGYSLRIQEATWLSGTRFILVGSVQDEDSNYLPVIYIGDLAKELFVTYSSNNPNCHQRESYESPKLIKLNIQEE